MINSELRARILWFGLDDRGISKGLPNAARAAGTVLVARSTVLILMTIKISVNLQNCDTTTSICVGRANKNPGVVEDYKSRQSRNNNLENKYWLCHCGRIGDI